MLVARQMDGEAIKTAVWKAVRKLYERDEILLKDRTNERSVIFHVGRYLAETVEMLSGEWQVDVEYNRDHGRKDQTFYKYFPATPEDDDRKVYPDLIVHDRSESTPAANLLVLEAKYTPSIEDRRRDYKKLRGFREVYHYRITAFLEFPEHPEPPRCMWIDKAAGEYDLMPDPAQTPSPMWE